MLVTRNQNKQYIIPNSLTHSSGIITAVMNTTQYSVSLTGLTAITLYYLYLRTNAGVTQLFYSAATPSVYRITYPEATLVGAFYSNGLSPVAFGSFVNIEGSPESNVFAFNATGSWNTNVAHNGLIARFGDSMEFEVKTVCSGAPNIAQYLINMPTGYVIDTLKTSSNTENVSGFGSALDLTTVYLGQSAIFTANQFFVRVWLTNGTYGVHSDITNTNPFTFGSADLVYFKIRVPIVGLTNTALKDL